MTTIDSLGIEIQSNSNTTKNGIDALSNSLRKLKGASKPATSGLDVFSKALTKLKTITTNTESAVAAATSQLSSVNGAAKSIDASSVSNVAELSRALQSFKGVKISSTISKQLTSISTALTGLNSSGGTSKIQEFVADIRSLTNLPKLNLTSTLKQVKKIPEVFAELSKVDTSGLGEFSKKMTELADALRPLGTEMQKIANGFSAFPTKIQKLINSTEKLTKKNNKASFSFTNLYHKFLMISQGVRWLVRGIGNAITESTNYVENVNLFSVAMGEYASDAKAYAETVSDVMGIDPSDWMRAQGVFMTISTGFGIAGDRAAKMSKNLTQLGYDLSSFYNISVEDAMTKLKSGLAGELEPLRAIGYDLSQAKLEATALALGIDKSVSSMTQAEKAQLRYYAIMTQVTTAQGDMARTLDDPANQLRVLKAQVTMASREIGNAFIPALNAVLPYAIAVTKVVRTLAATIAGLFGYKAPELADSTGKVVENTDAVQENLQGATDEAKKLKSYMLGFDELNIINPAEGATDDTSGMFDFELPEYDFMEGLVQSKVSVIVEEMKEWLGITDEIDTWAEFFETRLGNILKYVGLIGGGILLWKMTKGFLSGIKLLGKLLKTKTAKFAIAATITIMGIDAAKWIIETTDSVLEEVTAIVSASLLGLGAVLAFSGINIPLGIALMAVGAVSLASSIAMNTDKLSDEVKGVIATITAAVSVALLAVGAVLAFSGINIPLGIALIAGGALTMASSVIPNWDSLSQEVRDVITLITGIVGGGLLALGAILAFSGANIPLGIGFMLVGAVSLGTAIVLNWGTLTDEMKIVVGNITGIVGGALLALGAILTFSGANLPLGISLMAVGAVSLGSALALNWDIVEEKLQGPVGKVTALVSGAALALGAILAFSGVALPLGIALMVAGAAGLATVVALNWDKIVDSMRGTVGKITAIAGAAALVIGLILLFTGVGIPLGLGLILGGAAALGTAVAFNWDYIVDAVKKVWQNVTKFWDEYIAPVFTAEWWKKLGINIINGLISGIEGGINGIIGAFESMINLIVNGLNKISFDIPDWLGGGHFGIDISPVSFKRVYIERFAEGGFPDQGQMFIAREAGPELVGNIGRRAAVANNDQIVQSISVGVAEANSEQNVLLREQNTLLRALLEKDSGVYLDGRELSNSVDKRKREQGRVIITGGAL